MTVTAKVIGIPNPKVAWNFKGEDLSTNKAVLIENEGDRHLMKISKAAMGQAGLYTVTAVNDVGHEQKEITLYVFGE